MPFNFRQEPQKAIEYFSRAVTVDPSSAAGRLALGDALLRAKQPPLTRRTLSRTMRWEESTDGSRTAKTPKWR
jgi:predicted Zn-dependent protease